MRCFLEYVMVKHLVIKLYVGIQQFLNILKKSCSCKMSNWNSINRYLGNNMISAIKRHWCLRAINLCCGKILIRPDWPDIEQDSDASKFRETHFQYGDMIVLFLVWTLDMLSSLPYLHKVTTFSFTVKDHQYESKRFSQSIRPVQEMYLLFLF